MGKSRQDKRNKKLYVPDRSACLRQTGPVRRSYRERLSDLYHRVKSRSTAAEVQDSQRDANWNHTTASVLHKSDIQLKVLDNLSSKATHFTGRVLHQKQDNKDLFDAYQDLCKPRDTDVVEIVKPGFLNYQRMGPFGTSVLIEIFNNEAQFQKIYQELKKEIEDSVKVPMNNEPTTEQVKYELGKLVDAGVFCIKVLELLGEGSQAMIYKVQRDSDGYAAKVSKKDIFTKMLMNEHEILSSVNHPNILTVHEAIPKGFLMEALPYNLFTHIQKNFDLKTLLLPNRDTITIGILRAVSHLHSNGIVHLDIKPENVLLTAAGEAKLSDFGLSLRYMDELGRSRLLKGKRGSLPYLSPEVLCGREQNSMRPLDAWAVGVTMYTVFTGGRLPFGNISQEDIFQRQMECPVTVPYKMRAAVQNNTRFAGYFSVVYQLLNIQPKLRPTVQSALNMMELLG